MPYTYRPNYFPNRLNPVPDAEDRPDTNTEYLDEGMDSLYPEYSFPPGPRSPKSLYRGVYLDLNHPGAQEVANLLYGGDLFRHNPNDMSLPANNRMTPDGKIVSPYAQKTLGDAVLNALEYKGIQRTQTGDNDPYNPFYYMGTHWSDDPDIARNFAQGTALQGKNYLPIMVGADWNHLGEDTDRSGVNGYWPEEREVTMVPGQEMNVHTVQVLDPNTRRWHSVLDSPQTRYAATGLKVDINDSFDLGMVK